MLFSVYHIFIKICIDSLCGIKSKKQKYFLFVRSPVAPASLLAKNRALVSIFTCNGNHPWLPLLSLHKIFVLITFIWFLPFFINNLYKRNKHDRKSSQDFSRSRCNRNWLARFYYRKI